MIAVEETETLAILSAAASILIFVSTFPQVRQTWKTKLTRDNNLWNLIFCVGGLAVWTTYAAVSFQWIFVIGDGVDMVLWGSVLFVKVQNVRAGRESPQRVFKSEYCRKHGHIYYDEERCLICNGEKK